MRIPLLNLFKRYTQKVGQPPGTLVYLGEEPTEPVRITIIDYNETHLEEEEVQTVEACVPFIDTETVIIDTETVTWIQIEGIHEIPIIEEIGKCFGVDPLLLEDLMSPTQLPKIEISEDYVLIILESLDDDPVSETTSREQISLVIGPNFVLSLQENYSEIFKSVQNRLRSAQGRNSTNAARLPCLCVDRYYC